MPSVNNEPKTEQKETKGTKKISQTAVHFDLRALRGLLFKPSSPVAEDSDRLTPAMQAGITIELRTMDRLYDEVMA